MISNADNNALASGMFGRELAGCVRPTPLPARSLSAVTWNLLARTEGFELARHTVFFSADYRAEFEDIFRNGACPPIRPSTCAHKTATMAPAARRCRPSGCCA